MDFAHIYPSNTRNTTNNRNKILLPQDRTKHYGLNSINNIGACIWNDIPLYQIVKI